jgi:hypothetical protein
LNLVRLETFLSSGDARDKKEREATQAMNVDLVIALYPFPLPINSFIEQFK